MGKWLLLLAVLAGLFWWLTRARSGRRDRADEARRGAPLQTGGDRPMPDQRSSERERMVPCAHCGVLLPQSEALSGSSADAPAIYFCSAAHRAEGPQA